MFTGTGEPEEHESFAEYMAPIYRPGWRDQCEVEFVSAILEQNHISAIDFQRVRSALVKPLVDSIAREWRVTASEEPIGQCYRMPCSSTAVLETVSSKQRSTLKRKLRRLQSLEGFSFDVAQTEAQRASFYRDLIALHQHRWTAKGRPGVFASTVFREFHEVLSRGLFDRDQVLLTRLSLGGHTIAICYCLTNGRDCYYYQGGLEIEAYGSLSPGLMLHLLTADAAGERGLESYDLMLADGNSYKSRVASVKEELSHITVRKRWWRR